jgi:2-oxoglutarate dehydrogenase complex dehydrogenase (E1) component-like enzyme
MASSMMMISTVTEEVLAARNAEPNLIRLIEAYQKFGHIKANLNPLGLNNNE